MKTRAATMDGAWNTDDVVGNISQDFWNNPKAGAMKFMAQRDSMVRKNFTAGEPRRQRRAVRFGAFRPFGPKPSDLSGLHPQLGGPAE